jgi:hypothetical protein
MQPFRVCRLTLFSAVLCAWAAGASAQTVRVQLKISADEQLKKELQKYLEEDLRALPDVLLAGDSQDFTLSVIALKVVTRASTNVGVTFSVLVTAPYDTKIREFAEAHVPSERRAHLISMSSDLVKPLAHWVETAASGDVQQVCRSIITSFYKEVLKHGRPPDFRGPPR